MHFLYMNIIELKKKYEKVFKINLEDIDIYYRPFTAHELILIMKPGNENKHKYDIAREAVINKDDFDKLTNWASKESLYSYILNISNLGEEQEIIDKKLLIKNDLTSNPFWVMIKQIVSTLPFIPIKDLLESTADQLLFYTVLCEEIRGVQLINTKPQNQGPVPVTKTQKKSMLTPEQLTETGMVSSEQSLKEQLLKHGAKVKEFVKKPNPFLPREG